MTGTEAGTQVDLVFRQALQLVHTDPGTSIDKLAEILAGPDVPLRPVEQPFPAVPATLELTKEARKAFQDLPKLYGGVAPGERRALTAAELLQVTKERIALDHALAALEARKKAISETIKTHQDVTAEQGGRAVPRATMAADGETVIVAATPRNTDKHYLLAEPKNPATVPVHPLGRTWSNEYVNGTLVMGSAKDLDAAQLAGHISRASYLAATRSARVLDQPGLMALIRDNPEEGLKVLRLLSKRGAPHSSLYLRNLKE
jgi:hypothetical protein